MLSIDIRGRIEDVFAEITRTDKPIACFFNMKMHYDQLRPGHALQMRTKNEKYVGVVGEILECEPPTRFVHTFQFTQFEDPPCVVEYELEQRGEMVRFRMVLKELTPGTKSAKQMVSGGRMILSTLKAVVEDGRPPLATRVLFVVFALMGPLTPKRCLLARWDGARYVG